MNEFDTCTRISASMTFLFSSLISSTSCFWPKFLDSLRVFQKSEGGKCLVCVTITLVLTRRWLLAITEEKLNGTLPTHCGSAGHHLNNINVLNAVRIMS